MKNAPRLCIMEINTSSTVVKYTNKWIQSSCDLFEFAEWDDNRL